MTVFLDRKSLVDVRLNRPAFVADRESLILRGEALGAEMLAQGTAWRPPTIC